MLLFASKPRNDPPLSPGRCTNHRPRRRSASAANSITRVRPSTNASSQFSAALKWPRGATYAAYRLRSNDFVTSRPEVGTRQLMPARRFHYGGLRGRAAATAGAHRVVHQSECRRHVVGRCCLYRGEHDSRTASTSRPSPLDRSICRSTSKKRQ